MKKYLKNKFFLLLATISLATSQSDYSLDFTDSYASIPMNGALANMEYYTIEFWVYMTQIGNDEHIIGDDYYSDQIYFRTANNGTLTFLRGIDATSSISTNTWHHIAGVKNGDEVYLFVDGSLKDIKPYNNDYNPGNGDWTINHHTWASGSSNRSDGQIDEVRISNIARYVNDFNIPIYKFNPDINTVALWHFDENSGATSIDHSGNGYNVNFNSADWSNNTPGLTELTFPGCTDLYAENYDPQATTDDGSCSGYPDNGDYSLYFDRNSINVGEIGDYSSQVTVMGWVKTTDDQSYHAIVSGNCGNIMLTMHGGKILFGSQCSSPIPHDTYGTTELNNGEWYHVAATYDEYGGENNLKVYVNGNLEGESTKSGQFSGATGNFAIGSAPGGYEFINGNLDMVRIWNTALTQDQIQENMLSDNALVDDGLLADWKVSSGEGNILYDHSGNGNHGSIEGASYSAEIPSIGCTDPYASNFNSNANVDDGSCSGYPDNGQFSLNFDGIDDLVQINEPLFNPNEFSIAFYIKTSVNGKQLFWSGRTITASQHTENSFNFDLNEIDNFYTGFFHNDDGQSLWSYQNIYDNNYHQIVVTFKNGLAKHYIDGNLTASSDLNFNSINVTDGNFSTIGRGIGQPGVWGARFYEGNIDEVIIFDRSLTESDLTLMLSGAEYPDDISGHYKFNAGSGDILFDHSGNQKHGVISGATWSEDVYVPPIPPVIGGNNSLIFDGVDDLVQLNQDAFSGQTATLMAWFNPELNLNQTFDSGKPIYCQGASTTTWATFGVGLRPNSIWLEMGAPGNQIELTNNSFTYDSWNHIAVSFDNGLVNTYINGSLVSSVQAPYNTISNNGHGAFIGRRGNTSNVDENYSFQGMISNFSSVPYALNHNDIYSSMVNDELYIAGSYWNFNEGQNNTLNDLSSNSNHGIINGATWTGDAPKVGCMDTYADNYDPGANVNSRFCYGYPENGEHSLSFGASQDHVDLGSSMDSDQQFSIATWVYIDESIIPLNGQRTFINKVNSSNGNKSIFLGSYQSKVGFTVLTGQQSNIMYGSDNQNGSLALTQTPLVSGWQHVAAVFTGDSMLVYINGELDGNVVVFESPGSVNDYDDSVWHMADVLGGSGNVGGKISSMSVWSKPLKKYEIQNLMSESPNHFDPSLMASWRFTAGNGDILYDHSGNGNHGVISGAVWSDQIPYQGPWHVSAQGSDDNEGSQNAPFRTIQRAINSGGNHGEIIVEPGTYFEKLTANNKSFMLRSSSNNQNNHDDIGQINADVIIEGNYDGSILNLVEGSYHFEGITIRNGRSDQGGGINVSGAELMLVNCLIESNQSAGAGSNGAGIFAKNTSLSIYRSSIINNNATNENGDPGSGGGIYLIADEHESSLSMDSSMVSNNNATGDSGGGISLISNNNNPFHATINNSIFSNNSTTTNGGALFTSGLDHMEIYESTFENNSAGIDGGGFLAEDGYVNISNSYFFGNSAGDTGGGLRFFNGVQEVQNSVISNNHANVEGGGIKFTGSTPNINFCTIANNSSSVCAGGIVAVYDQVNIRNSIIYGNDVASLCTIQGGSFDVSYSNIEGGFEGESNIDSSPLFCDPNGNDFSLAQNSLSISAGEFGSSMGALGIGCSDAYVNNSLNFDGNDDNIELSGFNNVITDKLTIGMWIKPFSETQYQTIFRQENNIPRLLIQYYDGGIYWGIYTDNGWDEVSAPYDNSQFLNNWNYISVTYDGSYKKIYLNGNEIGSNTNSVGNIINNGESLSFGSHTNGTENYNGKIDEVSVWSIALSQEQIQEQMSQELLGYEQGLIGYWNFNQGGGSTLTDITGNGYDGVIAGATWSNDGAPIDPPPAVYGCNDPYAENYDPQSNTNDGSCVYLQDSFTFTKDDYADPLLEENQDRITANVWLTRGDNQPLFNAAFENQYEGEEISPYGTLWMRGPTALQRSVDNYRTFRQATGGNHQSLPGTIMSLYIIEEDIFYDIEFHTWTSNGNGGGFSYTRTPAQINSFEYPVESVYFEKVDFADQNLEQNQDRITDRTWITRGNEQGIYNPFSESSYYFESSDEVYLSPSNTLWAFSSTAQASFEDYKPFKKTVQDSIGMQSLPGHILSLYIESEDIYFDVEFHSWTCCQNGGGFSYTRTDQYGQSITFTKEDYGDWTLEENQDRITDDVWITRQDQHPLFNIAEEQDYHSSSSVYYDAIGSPENTEWSFGRTEDLIIDDYQPWQAAIGGHNPRGALGQFMSLHLIEEDIYFDVVFHSWTCCSNGGGFSYTRMPASPDSGPMLNGKLIGIVKSATDNSMLEGAHVVAVAEDESYSAEAFSDVNGEYSIDLIGSKNYFVNISYDGLIDLNEYVYVAPFEDTYLNASLSTMEDALVEGTVTDWYTNAPLASASVLLAYTDEEMITIESTTDENGYFMVQVPGEEDYDLFIYSDGYWVEHDAFYLSSGEHQVLNVGIAEMSAASRLYGTVRDFDTDELIPYAEIQLNCDQASDWDHTGELGTYRVFNYYPGDCDDGVLVITANGYETSVQSVGNIEFEAGSSYDLDITLVQGNDPDPGMLSGIVYSNIDGSTVGGAEIVAYNVSTTQLFSIETSDDGSYQLFLPESDYYISVNANDHEDYLDTLTVLSGQSITKDFYLDELYLNTVSGLITDLSGNPLFDIEVYVLPAGADYAINSTFTNENGEYSLQVPNGAYDFGAGNNGYYMSFEYAVELSVNDLVIDFSLTSVSEFDGGIAGIVHLNDGDDAAVWINVWKSDLTYQAYVSPDENGAYTLPLVNGDYSMYAWVPGSEYQPVFVPGAFTIEDNVINYDIYFVAPDGPEAPAIVFLEDVPNDQGGQLELAWTPGEPREYEIFPQYSVWRMEGEWNLVATVPYHGFDLYNMIVPTLGDSTSDGIFESMFMVTAHTLDQNTFFDSNPLTGYSIDNIFPAIPQQLMASVEGETVELDWNISADEDFSYYNVYRQDQSSLEAATIFETENNYYSDNIEINGDYQYWVTAVDVSGNESDPSEPAMVTLGVQEDLMPMEYALMQNYPNPFNPSTQIMYSLPKTSSVKIIIYDMLGSKIRTLYSGVQDAGHKNILWNATNENGDPVSAGMYIYTIEAESFFASKKMILLK